ncbi:MAG TPA: PQQ-binding-like beta-propeller repeat protein [Pyrinomonadaceae bacterium]|nr:PQQ-binding-like beta-propeller repeat protein [Pyrinomonadaceae bacterium]
MPRRCRLKLRFIFLIVIALAPVSVTLAQNKARQAKQVSTSLHLVWPAQKGVLRYRLQLARDEQFKDIVFDRAVFGTEYLVADLAPGRYYWHVAPAVKETGAYTKPRLIEITGETKSDAVEDVRTPALVPLSNTGWRTATGPIAQPLAAHLRSTTGSDLVGVNADGMAYGIDSSNGVALWAARFRPNAKRGEATGNGGAQAFKPVLIDGSNGLMNVVVAFDGGVRALEGATGRELWRATLGSVPVSGAVATPEGGGAKRLLIASDKALTILNPENGQTVSEVKLDAALVAALGQFPLGNGVGVIFSLEGGMLEVLNSNGERVRALKMDTTITTPPLVVTGPRGMLVLVGTENGLISLNAEDLKPIGRIATESDAPAGMLAAADLEGDGAPEVILITRMGRIAAISTTDGKIKWYNTGATDAASATFADLNNDGVLDVLVAAGQDFAHGFSGRDGTLIWRAEEEAKGGSPSSTPNQSRALVAVPSGDGSNAFVVGTDTAHTGLRAISLPKDSIRAARD